MSCTNIFTDSTYTSFAAFISGTDRPHTLLYGQSQEERESISRLLAEALSARGIPVFLTDCRGTLDRLSTEYPCSLWDIYGNTGLPLRTTVTELGPMLLALLLELDDNQTQLLKILFKIADESGLLMIDTKDLRAVLGEILEHRSMYEKTYGSLPEQSLTDLLHAVTVLETRGAEEFLFEPAIDVRDFLNKNSDDTQMKARHIQTDPETSQTDHGTNQMEPGTSQMEPGTSQMEPGTSQADLDDMQMDPNSIHTDPCGSQAHLGCSQTDPVSSQTDPDCSQTDPACSQAEFDSSDMKQEPIKGRIHILDCRRQTEEKKLYAAFLLFILAEFYEILPELTEPSIPRLVMIIHEADLFFEEWPAALRSKFSRLLEGLYDRGIQIYGIVPADARVSPDLSDMFLRTAKLLPKSQSVLESQDPSEYQPKAKVLPRAADPQLSDVLPQAEDLAISFYKPSSSDIDKCEDLSSVQTFYLPRQESGTASLSRQERKLLCQTDPLHEKYKIPFDRDSAYEFLKRCRTDAARTFDHLIAGTEGDLYELPSAETSDTTVKDPSDAASDTAVRNPSEAGTVIASNTEGSASPKSDADGKTTKSESQNEMLKRARSSAKSLGTTVAGTVGRKLGKSIGSSFGSFGETLGGNIGASLGRGIINTLIKS